jgi:predicted secreted hydrolase
MTGRGWGILGVAAAALAGAAFYLAPSNSAPTQSRPSQGADWISAAAGIAVEEFDRLAGPWELDLPADHGVHPEAHTEVWQVSAHLADEDGRPVGVQFLLFRIGLAGPDAPAPTSSWEPREIYRGHVVLTGTDGAGAVAEERFGRGMAGVAGHDATLRELRLDTWSLAFPARADAGEWTLSAGPGDIRVDLSLTPEKDSLQVDGDAAPFRGYAFSRLRVQGTVGTQADLRSVSGVAWFEHLWGALPIPGGTPVASDRLQVQLDDGSELSVIRSRRTDGAGLPTVEALVIDAEGTVIAYGDDVAHLEIARLWQGAAAAWPVDWRLRIGDLNLVVTPVTDAQEHDFMVSLWSGLVRAEGHRGDQPVSGLGTLQLTGYGE